MDELLGDVLAYLPKLREAGREAEARELLHSLTEGCNAPEILRSLQIALADLPDDLGLELDAARGRLLAKTSRLMETIRP
jgi:hypothetical protein